MKTLMVVWFLALGLILGPALHDVHFWHQVEKQALEADLVEGAQE